MKGMDERRSAPRRRGLGSYGEQRDGAPRRAENARRIGDPAEDRGLGDVEREGDLAVADRRRVAVLVIAFARRGRRAGRLTAAGRERRGLRVTSVGVGVRELAVLARVVLEEQQIGKLHELREEQAHEEHQRAQRRGPHARAPAETGPQRALGSRALMHPGCS